MVISNAVMIPALVEVRIGRLIGSGQLKKDDFHLDLAHARIHARTPIHRRNENAHTTPT